MILTLMSGDACAVKLLCGYSNFSALTPSGNSKVKLARRMGVVSLLTASMKVLPMQIRLPPKNGEKLNGLRFVPFGVK